MTILLIRPKSGILIGEIMDRNKLIIIGLIIVIVALVAAIGLAMPNVSKQDTNLTFKSGASINEGDSIKIHLTDVNGTPLDNQTVNITVTNEDKSKDYHSVVTDEKGLASFKIDKKAGKYEVALDYGGNEKYNGCNATQSLKIKEVAEAEVAASEDYSSTNDDYSSSNEDYRPDVDSSGITREQADEFGYTYTEEHGGHYIGSNDHWDEKAGVYHD